MKAKKTGIPEIGPRIQTFRFGNGLEVYVLPDHTANVCTIQAWVRTGSMHEQEFLGCGLSHFLEHMVFAGSQKYPGITEIPDTVTRFGGRLNAFTSIATTCYYMEVPSGHASETLDLLSDMIAFPLFPEDKFLREKDVILRECGMRNDRPEAVLFDRHRMAQFRQGAFRFPVIGFEEKIRLVDRAMMQTYFERRYTPGRIFFVVTGAVQPDAVRDQLERKLGALPVGRLDEPAPEFPEPQLCTRTETAYFPDPLARIMTGWRVAGIGHPDSVILDLAARVLGGQESSRLYQRLITEKKIASRVHSACFQMPGCGSLFSSILCDTGEFDRVRSETERILERFGRNGVEKNEIDRAIRIAEFEHLRSQKSVSALANSIGHSVLATGRPDEEDRVLRRLRELSTDEVGDVLGACCRNELLTTVNLLPEEARRSVKKTTAPPVEKCLETVSFSGGQRMIYLADPGSGWISLDLLLRGGVLYEPTGSFGVSSLLANSFFSGTKTYGEQIFSTLLDDHGIQLSAVSRLHGISVRLSCLQREFPFALDLLCSMLGEPLFPKKSFAAERRDLVQSMESGRVNPTSRALMAVREAIFGEKHPLGVSPDRALREAASVTRDTMVRFFHEVVLHARSAVFAVSGDLSRKDARHAVDAVIDAIAWSESAEIRVPKVAPRKKTADVVQIPIDGKEQAVAAMAFSCPALNNSDSIPFEVLQHVCSTMSSPIFKHVREEEGLAYYATMSSLSTLDAGAAILYAGAWRETADRVLEIFREQCTRFATLGLSDEEFESGRAGLLHSLDTEKQDPSAVAYAEAAALFLGCDWLGKDAYRKRLDSLSLSEVNRVAKKVFSAVRPPTCIVGDVGAAKKT